MIQWWRVSRGHESTADTSITDEAKAQLVSIIRAADDAIYIIGRYGTIETWNPGAERMYGYTAAEVIGQSVELLLPPDNQDYATIRDLLLRGEPVRRYETVRRRKDGELFDVSLTITRLGDGENGGGYAAIARDITESKAAQQRLALTDRLASIGILAASIGHDVNNPLAVIIANLRMACDDLADTSSAYSASELREMLRDALDAAHRIRDIVSDLGAFTRQNRAEKVPLVLSDVCDAAIRLSGNAIRHRARITKRYGQTPVVEANEARLVQVFANLLVNAYQAIEDGDGDHEIVVSTRTDAQGRAVGEVLDDGPGMPPEILRRVFDPFFTTKGVGRGNGLGLTVSHHTVVSLGGTIEVESQPGRGALFRVVLPPAEGTAPKPRAFPVPARPHAIPARRGRVLVVDDDATVARAVHRMLEVQHDVTSVVGGRAALELFDAGHSYDLILCDLMMPDVNGMDVYAYLQARTPHPSASLVFITGGAFTMTAERFLAGCGCIVLNKPVMPEELCDFVQEFLARS